MVKRCRKKSTVSCFFKNCKYGKFINFSYIRIYGLKFSKEDHVKFIKIFMEMMVIPDLGFSQVNKYCMVLTLLLKDHRLLSPEDIEIDWKQLNEIAKIIIYKSDTKGLFYRHTW